MVSVCPIRLRIGTQTKVLEALACGTPVVTTSEGNSGVQARPGEHLLVGDTAQDFAAATIGLLRGERWHELSENGRRFVIDNFSWEAGVGCLEAILREVARERGPGGAQPDGDHQGTG